MRTHVILGFGVVRVPTVETAGNTTKVNAVGLYAGNGNASLGWISQTRVELKTNSNVILEIK